jgi:hypothetical protein
MIATARFLRFTRRGAPQDGPVAQWSEPAAHNGLVAGSSPARPTSHPPTLWRFLLSTVLARGNARLSSESRKIQSPGGWFTALRAELPALSLGTAFAFPNPLVDASARDSVREGGSGSQQRERRLLPRIAVTTTGSPRSRSAHRRSLCRGYAARGM